MKQKVEILSVYPVLDVFVLLLAGSKTLAHWNESHFIEGQFCTDAPERGVIELKGAEGHIPWIYPL